MIKTFEDAFSGVPSHGWLTVDEAHLLYRTAQKTSGPILEVGCYYGRSTVLLAGLGRVIHAVDPFLGFSNKDPSGDVAKKSFLKNTEAFPDVVLHKKDIRCWKPRPCGFAYLDGDHTYTGTVSQIKVALKCDPSWIAVHDVNDKGGGLEVKRACVELLGQWTERENRLAVFKVAL